jgi:hypothetical protein
MTKHEGSPDGASGDKDSIAELLRLAGPRPDVPADVRQRVHDAVQAEWRSTLRQRRTLRWGVPLALAATVILGIALSSRVPEIRVPPIATVALVEGDENLPGGLSTGDAIFPGDAISTDDSGVALTYNNGLSLRLDAGTAASFDSIEEVTLLAGRIYADTGEPVYDDTSITIRTSVGSATDIGTLFAVEHLDGDMSVAVREGRVDVSGSGRSYTAEAGDMLTLKANDDVVFDKVTPYDDAWDWTETLAPTFEIENRPLADFLKWAARETGRELVFENDDTRLAAMSTRLHGSVSGFTPSEAVASVLPTTSFEYSIDERRILIGSK